MKDKKRDKILEYAKKIKSIDILGSKCINCGEIDPIVLCFHHLKDKEKKINEIWGYRWSFIENEIKKCELLCCNCHNEYHFNKSIIDFSHRNRKMKLLDLFEKDGCEICGYNKCIASLEFHHLEDKKFDISNIRIDNFKKLNNILKIISELDKCQLVCSNCHKKIHHSTFFNENKLEIYSKSKNIREISKKIDRNIVFEMMNNGYKQIDISKHFNVTKAAISKIVNNKCSCSSVGSEHYLDRVEVGGSSPLRNTGSSNSGSVHRIER